MDGWWSIMVKKLGFFSFTFLVLFLLISPSLILANSKQYVYDNATLLNQSEIDKLEMLAEKLSEEHETDFIIVSYDEEYDVMRYTQDFYDENELGYDKAHGNTAMLTIDMNNREIYLAGFYKGEKYLDNERLDLIRDQITPSLTEGDYFGAFETFLEKANRYMQFRPGVNPENILFQPYFRIGVPILIAIIVVALMAFHTGGRVTTNDRTYLDTNRTRVNTRRDRFINKTVTKRRKPSNNNKGGGSGTGGGGGITRGGHSHSGSRGSF